jgi:hypothetical protein
MRAENWIESAMAFYAQRARVLKARRWLAEELEEEFVSECLMLEVAERQHGGEKEGPDRIRITTKALSAVRRSLRSMSYSVRSKLEGEPEAEASESVRAHVEAAAESRQWDDVSFVASLMDVVCGMLWMVWLSRGRTKPKGSGYTIRSVAAMTGVPRMRAARAIAALEPWFEAIWQAILSGAVSVVRRELLQAEEREERHFRSVAETMTRTLERVSLPIERSMLCEWLLRCGLLPVASEVCRLMETAGALGLVGEGGRYMLAPDGGTLILSRQGTRTFLEDLGTIATCRQRGMSWNELVGLHATVGRLLSWVARLGAGELPPRHEAMAHEAIDELESLLSEHPLGLQFWGGAMALGRAAER